MYQIDIAGLDALLARLAGKGYALIGPVARDGAIGYEPIASTEDLPRGLTDVQGPGTYRLADRDDDALFGFNVGPHAWKRFLDPPHRRLWRATRSGATVAVETEVEQAPRYAFIGVRACDLAAIAVFHRVQTTGGYPDATYLAAHDGAFVLAVNCTQAASTCFCTSMGTGPRASGGYDLALTEVLDNDSHRFLVEVGSERGREMLSGVSTQDASPSLRDSAQAQVRSAANSIERVVDTDDIKELLYRNDENPHWDAIAARCLSCANCTMVCPTCFCSKVEDVTDLAGEHAERWKRWDSCFNLDHSYLNHGPVRASPKSRYRQWLTHKFAAWIDQFESSGCTGCGRCIAWCPVGIDVTDELAAIRASDIRAGNDTPKGPDR